MTLVVVAGLLLTAAFALTRPRAVRATRAARVAAALLLISAAPARRPWEPPTR